MRVQRSSGPGWVRPAVAVCGLLLGLSAHPAAAQDGPWKRFNLEVGGMYAATDSSVTLGPASLGVSLDAERALGLDRGLFAGYASADYRLGSRARHRIAATYQLYLRSGGQTLDEELVIAGETFPVNASLESQYDVQAFALKYQYSVFMDDRMDLAVGLAVYAIPLLLRLEAVAGEGAGERVSQFVWAPVPSLSLRGTFAISPAWFLHVNLDWIYLDVSGFEGSMANTRVAVEWRFSQPVGIGLGFDAFRMEVEAEEGSDYPAIDFTGRFRTNFSGALLYLAVRL